MQHAYYFVLSSLPTLSRESPVEMGWEEFVSLLESNLSRKDMGLLREVLEPIDIRNLQAFWQNKSFDERGNFSPSAWEDVLLVGEGVPSYFLEFLENFDEEARASSIPFLLAAMAQQTRIPFLRDFFQKEREIRLILLAIRAKEWGRDILQELRFEDPFDPLVLQILAQKDAPTYTPPREYEELFTIFSRVQRAPFDIEKALFEYRWREVEEIEEAYPPFSIERILGYAIRLLWREGEVTKREQTG